MHVDRSSHTHSSIAGSFTFVLHSHIPYCRRAGHWPHGEEWLHEAIAETYLPLLNALYDLDESGVDYRLTLGLTPILVEQLADPLIYKHFHAYTNWRIDAAEQDYTRFKADSTLSQQQRTQLCELALYYRDWYRVRLETLDERFGGDMVGAFRRLQDRERIEILVSAATHAYLPLLLRDSSIYGQLHTAVHAYERHFGRRPRSIWLPECAYRPAYITEEGGPRRLKPGIEDFLANEGLEAFYTETHAITGGLPVGKAAGDAIGYGGIPDRENVPFPITYIEPVNKTTYRPYLVYSATRPPSVAVYGRNAETGQQVWAASTGYPGDYAYREFHRKDPVSGLCYWRVTTNQPDLEQKEVYDLGEAQQRIQAHADHFSGLVETLLDEYRIIDEEVGMIVSAYDTELFGHWWFEGIDWLKAVLHRLASNPRIQLTTGSAYLHARPPDEVLALPESSWGEGGTHITWGNEKTGWMWHLKHAAEYRMERLAQQFAQTATPQQEQLLNQAARELILLQSSDWSFLVTTAQANQYAIDRFREHLARFHSLADLAERGVSDDARVAEYYELDNPFPDIDFRSWLPREQPPLATSDGQAQLDFSTEYTASGSSPREPGEDL